MRLQPYRLHYEISVALVSRAFGDYNQEALRGFLLDVGHREFPRGALRNEVFIRRVIEARLDVGTNLADSRLAIPILRHFVEKQLQRRQRDFTRRLLSNDRNNVFSKETLEIFLRLLRPLTGLDCTECLPELTERRY
jgi:hypothetical protein